MKILLHKDTNAESPDMIFVEIEDDDGRPINEGEWAERGGGYWEIELEKTKEHKEAIQLIEVYEWLFENNSCVGLDSAIREDGRKWVVWDVDGEIVSRGRTPELAAWEAWDLAKNP